MSKIPQDIFEKIQKAKERQLKKLDLSYEGLDEIPNEVFELEQLEVLDLSANHLTTLPERIGYLQNLTDVDLGDNQLTTLPETIGHLQNLIRLYLYNNRIKALPEGIGYLQNLTHLNLSSNNLTVLPEKITRLQNLKILLLQGNPLEKPPLEIVKKGFTAIKEYFRQLDEAGKDYLYEAKLLIIGEGGAGKTSLARKIENATYQLSENEPSTEGIEVIQWRFPLPEDLPSLEDLGGLNKTFRVNIWDFGGQEIYHATHQFFLTKRSLYALVADTRREDTDFYYWLNVVELLSDNSPILIIKNEKQDRQREINERQLRGQFTNLEKTLATNLATNRGLDDVTAEIKHYLTRLPHVGTVLPKTWVKVREALENDPRNYISLDEYLTICQQHSFTQLKDKLQLSGYLHDLGVCLHFQDDPLLKKTVILKPHWGTAAVSVDPNFIFQGVKRQLR